MSIWVASLLLNALICDEILVAFNNITAMDFSSSSNYKLLIAPSVTKYKNNPFFGQNDSNQLSYFNVIYTPNKGNKTYEIFYNQFDIESKSSSLKYAQSQDGYNWIFPTINNKYNDNLILSDASGNGIWRDKYTTNPNELYKAFGILPNTQGTATSPDGIHWNNFRNLSINNRWDTQNNIFYDIKSNKYIGITRGIEFPPRTIARTESNESEFNSTFSAVTVVENEGNINQTYTQITFDYYNIYLGLIMIYDTDNQKVYCELRWSMDTIQWFRIGIGQQLIPLATTEGIYDYGMVFVAAYPIWIEKENRLRLYYMSGDGPHSNGPRNDSFALAFLRKDGYAGIVNDMKNEIGFLQSFQIKISGTYFIVNVDIIDGQNGLFLVGFKNVTGYEIKDCTFIKKNVTDYVVTWENGNNLNDLIGTSVIVEFQLDNAILYTFGFTD